MPAKRDPIERFHEKYVINPDNGCWEWTATLDQSGYGLLGYEGSMKGAHRFSYKIYKGEIPKGLYVLHKCDNPPCVNPEHLFLGTQKDNMDDMYNKGRAKRMSCPGYVMYKFGNCRCEGCVAAYEKQRDDYNERVGIDVIKERERIKYLKHRDKKLEYARQYREKKKLEKTQFKTA